MKLEKWALIAEIVSAIAIVLSLVFVGFQVRQGAEATDNNTAATRGQVLESLMNADLDVLMLAAEHPYLVSFSFNPDEHTEQEIGRATVNFYVLLRTRDHFWKQFNSGFLDEATYVSYRNTLLLMVTKSAFYRREWEAQIGHGWLDTGFVEDINAELRNLDFELTEQE